MRKMRLMKVRISDMLDCSAEILTQEQESEECSPDEIVKIVFERVEIKRRR